MIVVEPARDMQDVYTFLQRMNKDVLGKDMVHAKAG
jgi:hypothetical protein